MAWGIMLCLNLLRFLFEKTLIICLFYKRLLIKTLGLLSTTPNVAFSNRLDLFFRCVGYWTRNANPVDAVLQPDMTFKALPVRVHLKKVYQSENCDRNVSVKLFYGCSMGAYDNRVVCYS